MYVAWRRGGVGATDRSAYHNVVVGFIRIIVVIFESRDKSFLLPHRHGVCPSLHSHMRVPPPLYQATIKSLNVSLRTRQEKYRSQFQDTAKALCETFNRFMARRKHVGEVSQLGGGALRRGGAHRLG